MAIIVFQHSTLCGPGRLGATLRDHGFQLDIRRPDLHGAAAIPPDLDNVHGVVSLGGPQNVGESHPWMEPELAFLRRAHAAQLPIIGVCLGSQLAAHALGGKVGPMGEGGGGGGGGAGSAKIEAGFTKLSINPAGQIEPMLAGLLWDSMQFQLHGQEVKALPPDAANFAGSAACKTQAWRAGLRTFGFQHHFECDRPMIDMLVKDSEEWLRPHGVTVSDIAAQADRHYPEFARLADRLCVNLATFLFPFERRVRQ
ncbi:MAG: type 1 glutamine amidotransferase [Phycisphaerales bacterium]